MPDGSARRGWAWADAVVLELMSIATGLEDASAGTGPASRAGGRFVLVGAVHRGRVVPVGSGGRRQRRSVVGLAGGSSASPGVPCIGEDRPGPQSGERGGQNRCSIRILRRAPVEPGPPGERASEVVTKSSRYVVEPGWRGCRRGRRWGSAVPPEGVQRTGGGQRGGEAMSG